MWQIEHGNIKRMERIQVEYLYYAKFNTGCIVQFEEGNGISKTRLNVQILSHSWKNQAWRN